MEKEAGAWHMTIEFKKRTQRTLYSIKPALTSIVILSCKIGLILVACLVLWILFWTARAYSVIRSIHSSCPDTQPLVSIHHNFLPMDAFEDLKSYLPKHPLMTNNNLAEDKFNSTVGWLVKFNRESLPVIRSNPLFQLTLPYMDRVLIPESNAFVFNLLVCKETDDDIAVKPHFDSTVGFMKKYKSPSVIYLAHQVNVLYISMPVGVEGGELEVWPFENDGYTEDGKAVIKPVENMMVAFRGDAYHKVRGFKSPSKKSRISLVFEQYQIPEKIYYQTMPYCENRECRTA